MNWIKDVYLDLVVLLAVLLYGLFSNEVLLIVLWVYTALLFTGKILSFFMPSLRKRASNTSVPATVYHLIYLVIVGTLVYVSNYYLAGTWLVIWGLSTYTESSREK